MPTITQMNGGAGFGFGGVFGLGRDFDLGLGAVGFGLFGNAGVVVVTVTVTIRGAGDRTVVVGRRTGCRFGFGAGLNLTLFCRSGGFGLAFGLLG
jgi:hypothetical protein